MCRNIRTLHNFAPPATDAEIEGAALQYVRKIAGFTKPSKANEPAFAAAVTQVTAASKVLLDALVSPVPARHRDEWTAKARERAARSRAR